MSRKRKATEKVAEENLVESSESDLENEHDLHSSDKKKSCRFIKNICGFSNNYQKNLFWNAFHCLFSIEVLILF